MKPLLFAFLLCGLTTSVQAEPETARSQAEQIRLVLGQRLVRHPENRSLRFRYAQAAYQAGHHETAKYHLRRLMRTTKSEKELGQIKTALAQVIQASPFSFDLNFSILPSTNIRKTSSNQVFDTLLGQFVIIGGGKEKSGVGFRFGGRLNYEQALSNGDVLTYGAELNRSQYPTDRLNNFDGAISVAWGRYSTGGYSQAIPYVNRFFYDESNGGSLDSTRYGVILKHEHYLSDYNSVTGSLTVEHRDYDELNYLDGNLLSLSIGYRGRIHETYGLNLKIGGISHSPKQDHLKYYGASFQGEVTRAVAKLGVVGINTSFDIRHYKGNFPALDISRNDKSASLGISLRSPFIKAFNMMPKLSCRIQQNWSNVALYDYHSKDCAIAFERRY